MPKNDEKQKTGLLAVREETADLILKKVQVFENDGELALPENYSAPNALKSAWLMLQDVVDKNKKPALEVCTKASIANAMLNMVIQGLNPVKKQCYFIVYGQNLTLSPSYLGNKAVALRLDTDLKDIYAEVVYEGDVVKYSITLGQRSLISHEQEIGNINGANIIGAYAMAVTHDDVAKRTELMSMDEIKQAWMQSRMNPLTDKGHIKAGSTHAKFTAEMAKKTVTNRLCKHIIGASDDRNLVAKASKMTDDDAAKAQAQAQADEHGNTGDVIDIKPDPKQKKAASDPKQKKAKPKVKPDPDEKEALESNAEQGPMTDEEKQAIMDEERETADHVAEGKPPF